MHKDTMQAVVLEKNQEGASLFLREVPRKAPGAGEVAVSLRAAALNRRDVWIRLGRYAGIRLPTILGSDGAGVVSAVGPDVNPDLIGQEVVINPSLGFGENQEAQAPDYRILGMPDDGTYAESVVVPAENIVEKPAHLSFIEAAALPLAGLTAYRALCVRGQVRPGQTVLIPGIGSGVSTMALLMARHVGARVIVTSGHADKLAKAQELGAAFGVSYRDEDWADQIAGHLGCAKVDLVVDGAGQKAWENSLNLLRPGGRIVSYGATAGIAQVDLRKLFWKQLNVLGTTMGSERDFAEMVALFSAGKLRPVIDEVFPLSEAAAAHVRMELGAHMGKLVLRIGA